MSQGPEIDGFAQPHDIKLHYTVWNADADDTTLLVHGLNRELHVWDSVAERLAATRRVICVDLRGHGRSGWAADGYSVQAFASDLAGLLDHLGIEEIQYTSHSLGSRIGIAFAATWRGRLRHLLLSECGPEIPRDQALALREFSRNRRSWFDSPEETLGHLRALNPAWQDEFHRKALEHEYRTNWVGKVVRRADPELHWLYETEIVEGNPYLWECWSRITAPITVLWAAESGFFDDRIIARMREAQPGMSLYRPKGTHYFLRESPEEFLRFAEAALAPVRRGVARTSGSRRVER
ncbi:MAG TPA: alpha/beta hydrolase [Amycolatopsis sp.]|uniref:alpha/beta fold hydrolase n=1 Tax=Amycolatopsis sp. TaxID=37632 RepID=UPI002B490BA2|nr:alpha/beta hydrolase [Amycolatopsis sp.]HKS47014.1 alpha/beta hydrolase [Amycolatopsis sp.]